MTEQQLQDLVERVAGGAAMPPTPFAEDELRGQQALGRRRGALALTLAATVAASAAASVAVVGGGLVLGDRPDPDRPDRGPAATGPATGLTATPSQAAAPGTAGALRAAVARILDPTGARIVASSGSSSPVERNGQVVMVSTELGWQTDGGATTSIAVRVAASAADAEWGCEDRCELTTYDVGGLTAWTTPRDDSGRTGTLLVRADGSAAALDVPPELLSSGEVTRDDIDRVLTSPELSLPTGTPTGPLPVPGALVDRIAVDALPGLEVTGPSTDLHPAGVGLLDGAEVLWQADPATWAGGSCFWSRRCTVEVVDGARLELSRAVGGPFAGYVSVEHQGPVWRTRVLVPEAVALDRVVPLLTDARWPH